MDDYIRYAKNIRKLAEQARNNNRSLTAADIRSAILAERAIGYITGNGNTAVSKAGVPGTTSPFSSFGNLVGFASNEEIQNVTNTVQNNYKTINNALNMRIGQKLQGISDLKDCVTGKGMEITNNPEFKPPANWDNATTPSITNPLRWDLGFKWASNTSTIVYGENAQECADAVPGVGLTGATWTFDGFVDPAIVGSTAPFVAHYNGTPGSLSAYVAFVQVPCVVGEATCPAEKHIPWPTDGKMQLARGADGKFKYSPNEAAADVIPGFTDNKHSKLDLCFDDGSGRKAGLESTYDGGYMLYERDPTTGDPIGRVSLFDQNNNLTNYIPVDEMSFWQPTGL